MESPNILIDQYCLRKSSETTCVTPIHWATEKIPILKQIRKDETYSGHKSHPPGKCQTIKREFLILSISLEKAMATHSSTLAWKTSGTEEPGSLQSMGSWRVGRGWATSFSYFNFHALEKTMATHSSTHAWRIPGMAEPGGLPSMGLHRVGHNWSDLAAKTWGSEVTCLSKFK